MSTAPVDGHLARLAGEGERLAWRADMLVKAAASETRGAFTLIDTTNPPDAGPPLHLHRDVDEAFYVLEGDYEFTCGPQQTQGGPGSFVLLPRGVPHRYRSGAQGGRLLILFTPGGTEKYFRELAEAMSDPGATSATMSAIADRHGIELLGPY